MSACLLFDEAAFVKCVNIILLKIMSVDHIRYMPIQHIAHGQKQSDATTAGQLPPMFKIYFIINRMSNNIIFNLT